jgi:hypothetical protein
MEYVHPAGAVVAVQIKIGKIVVKKLEKTGKMFVTFDIEPQAINVISNGIPYTGSKMIGSDYGSIASSNPQIASKLAAVKFDQGEGDDDVDDGALIAAAEAAEDRHNTGGGEGCTDTEHTAVSEPTEEESAAPEDASAAPGDSPPTDDTKANGTPKHKDQDAPAKRKQPEPVANDTKKRRIKNKLTSRGKAPKSAETVDSDDDGMAVDS